MRYSCVLRPPDLLDRRAHFLTLSYSKMPPPLVLNRYMQASLYRDICRIQPEPQDNDGDEGEGVPAGPSKDAGQNHGDGDYTAVVVAVGGHMQLWQAMRDPDAELWAPTPFNWSLEPLPRMH